MSYENIYPVSLMYVIDIYDEEYIIKDSEEYEFIFHSFKRLRSVNSSIVAINGKGDFILIEAIKVKKVYILTKNFISMRIF